MKSFSVTLFSFTCSISLLITNSFAQVSQDYAVLLSATYNEAIPEITLNWNAYPDVTQCYIYKKLKEETSWDLLETLDETTISYTDTSISVGEAYEYKVQRISTPFINAEGYIYAGIKVPATDYRGTCLFVIDTSVTSTLTSELQQFMKDVSGDGWSIKRINVSRNNSIDSVKDLIVSLYESDSTLTLVILFGHVPVPYSGNLYPDGHPDHQGAWAFDGYYADMDGEYTDETVNNATATRDANKNIPGDGKFDQNYFDSEAELQVGRIDLYDLPAFTETEENLLKRYLDKDHAFRTGLIKPQMRGLIDDNFGAFYDEAFASNGWRNFSPMFTPAQVFEVDYFSTLREESYLWSYGCGGGWYQGAGGVGSTPDFAVDSVKSVFTMLFGSYFGDWDITDNFLRAPLAANGYTLTNAWAGRPWWHFHHMALGENIGFSTRLTQNNSTTYDFNYCSECVHIALMGDPTLRMLYPLPVNSMELITSDIDQNVLISWEASADDIEGYYVYRSSTEFGKYDRITSAIITTTSYIDISPINGMNHYMLRAVKLEETPSGSYYNLSTGIADSVFILVTGVDNISENKFSVYPNPATDQLKVETSFSDIHIAEVFDATGKIILQQYIPASSTIDVSKLAAGIYYLRINGSVVDFVKL